MVRTLERAGFIKRKPGAAHSRGLDAHTVIDRRWSRCARRLVEFK